MVTFKRALTSGALFQQILLELINPKHPLVKLADAIDLEERTFSRLQL